MNPESLAPATTAAKTDAATKRVEPVHQPAVAGNEAARILDAETALERGFEQVAKLGDDRGRKPEPEQRDQADSSTPRA